MHSYYLDRYYAVDLFFSVVLKVPLFSAGSAEKKTYFLSLRGGGCELCVSSETGGEKHFRIYPYSPAPTVLDSRVRGNDKNAEMTRTGE